MGNVKFKNGSKADYASATKDSETLYFTTEDEGGSIYKGDSIMGTSVADKLTLTEDITVTGTSVGNLADATVIEAGMSIQDILKEMLMKELYPKLSSNPSIALSGTSSPTAEVGTAYTLSSIGYSYTDGKFTGDGYTMDGGYSDYGTDEQAELTGSTIYAGCDLTTGSVSLTKSVTGDNTAGDFSFTTGDTTTSDAFTLLEGTVKYSLTGPHGASTNVAKTNFGNAYTSLTISAASKTAAATYTGKYYCFYGNTTVAPADLTSANVRGLGTSTYLTMNSTTAVGSTSADSAISYPAGNYFMIAVPSKYAVTQVYNAMTKEPITVNESETTISVTTGTISTDYTIFYIGGLSSSASSVYNIKVGLKS